AAEGADTVDASCSLAEPPQKLTVTDAIDNALEHQPQLLIARAELAASQAGVTAARVPFLPSAQAVFDGERFVPANGATPVTVVGNNVVGGTQSYSGYVSVNLNWNLFNSGRDLAGYRGAKAELRSSEAALRNQSADTVIDVLQAYADLYAAQIIAHEKAHEV